MGKVVVAVVFVVVACFVCVFTFQPVKPGPVTAGDPPAWVIDADSGARQVMNMIVADSVFQGDSHKDTGSLLAINTNVMH